MESVGLVKEMSIEEINGFAREIIASVSAMKAELAGLSATMKAHLDSEDTGREAIRRELDRLEDRLEACFREISATNERISSLYRWIAGMGITAAIEGVYIIVKLSV